MTNTKAKDFKKSAPNPMFRQKSTSAPSQPTKVHAQWSPTSPNQLPGPPKVKPIVVRLTKPFCANPEHKNQEAFNDWLKQDNKNWMRMYLETEGQLKNLQIAYNQMQVRNQVLEEKCNSLQRDNQRSEATLDRASQKYVEMMQLIEGIKTNNRISPEELFPDETAVEVCDGKLTEDGRHPATCITSSSFAEDDGPAMVKAEICGHHVMIGEKERHPAVRGWMRL